MILYVNGDSNSAGAELVDLSNSWFNVLSKELKIELVNQAIGSASNDRILRTTQEFINQHTDDIGNYFIIIGWSSWEREEWLHDGVYYQVTASGRNSVPEEFRERYQQWVLAQNSEQFQLKSAHWHDQIINLHQQLISLNVKHLFFNAVMAFDKNDNFNWNNHYLNPYVDPTDDSYYFYLKRQGFCPTQRYHHQEEAQIHWANVLKKHILDFLL
jgi:hypothetical protein